MKRALLAGGTPATGTPPFFRYVWLRALPDDFR